MLDDIYQSYFIKAILRHLRYNIFTQNSQHLMFLLAFTTLEYLLILEIRPTLLQKQYNSLIKKVLLICKNHKALKREEASSARNDHPLPPPPYVHDKGIFEIQDTAKLIAYVTAILVKLSYGLFLKRRDFIAA